MADGWVLSPEAESDLEEIWFFGAERWSARQADIYQDDLFKALDMLAAAPRISPERSALSPPLRIHPHRSHIIAYREAQDGVEVFRILHSRQDWLAAFSR